MPSVRDPLEEAREALRETERLLAEPSPWEQPKRPKLTLIKGGKDA